MADLAGANGQQTEFKVVGKRNVPGKLSYNIATGKAKYGTDATAQAASAILSRTAISLSVPFRMRLASGWIPQPPRTRSSKH